ARTRRDRRRGALRDARDARRAPARHGDRAGRMVGRRRSPGDRGGAGGAARGRAPARPHPGAAGAQPRHADRDRRPQPPAASPRPAERAPFRRGARPRARRTAGEAGPGAALVTESLRLVVVTGLSGSGKSTAIHVLEDLGFYCIDNLPIALIPRLVELWETSRDEVRRVALGIDVRERHFLAEFPRVFDELRAQDVALEVLYLEASDDVLVRRFSETRRPHPADQGGGIADGIRREREKLHGLRELADRILDTSAFTVHEFRSALRDLVDRPEPGTMTIGLLSFGYKYGLPTDADLVLDC